MPTAAATTAAGTLVKPLNVGNATVDTTAQLDGNQTLTNPPPAGGVAGTLTIKVDGITAELRLQHGRRTATAIRSTIFINSFNAGHFGVTASYDATSQTIVFARDPNNIDLVHRAAMAAAGGTTTPDFTLTDATSAAVQPLPGTPATGLLDALGADGINGVNQNATNAFGVTNGGNVTSMLNLFTNSYGVPAMQTTSPTVIAGSGPRHDQSPPVASPTAFAQLNVGDVLTIDAGTASAGKRDRHRRQPQYRHDLVRREERAPRPNFSITSAQHAPLAAVLCESRRADGPRLGHGDDRHTHANELSSNINAVRQSTDGINVDEETQNLVKFQNAYGAAAHVISVLSSMLEDAINLGSGTTF